VPNGFTNVMTAIIEGGQAQACRT